MVRSRYEFNKRILLVILLAPFAAGGCQLKQGWPWFRNMYDSQAPQPQEDARMLPEGTLPTEGGELAGAPAAREDSIGREGTGPAAGAEERGKALFEQFCAVCHGRDAKGLELTEDFFTPDITDESYLDYPDEDLYTLLIEGGLNMPSYREELAPRDRWLVIDYLRTLQRGHGR